MFRRIGRLFAGSIPHRGDTIIGVYANGCMGHHHELRWIGVVTGRHVQNGIEVLDLRLTHLPGSRATGRIETAIAARCHGISPGVFMEII